jgi:ubiquinone biosynthesis O-methyltransferase
MKASHVLSTVFRTSASHSSRPSAQRVGRLARGCWRCNHTHSVQGEVSSVDDAELRKFSALSADWWRDDGPFTALHAMNKVRVPLIRRAILELSAPSRKSVDAARPLTGIDILDVGCGGGILSEALARLGAQVTGIDAAEESIRAAELHRSVDPTVLANLTYAALTAEDILSSGARFDAVIASEVVEHVNDLPVFLASCAGLVRVRAQGCH